MRGAYRLLTRWWSAFALAISLAMLGAAHAFERFGGLAPCNLCLKQREVYWAAVAVAAVATVWHLASRASRGTPRIAAFMLFLVFTTGAVTALFHAGGELNLWSLPAACAAGAGGADAAGMAALLDPTAPPPVVVACDEAAWVFLGVSMAGWNGVVSIALAMFSLLAAKRPKDARAPKP